LEERELGKSTKVYSVAPGVIDTDMQIQIRSTNENAFSSLENFQNLKSENKLETPERIALKLDKLLSFDYKDEVIFSLNDVAI
jgi:benzil reductase ((S)-benzoin forming)